jgi:dsRNA-specific ribonuclease
MAPPKEKVQHYFGKLKDGSDPILKDGINYTLETLSYMTPYSRSINFIEEIIKRVPERPFDIIEACAGIGGDTINFAQSPYVGSVITYECEKSRTDILINNLKLYDISHEQVKGTSLPQRMNVKVLVNSGEFKGTKTDNKCVVYIDPPWISPGTKKPWKDITPEDYLYEGIKLGKFTLEQWIDSMKTIQLIVLKVPPGYRLIEEDGFTYERLTMKDKIEFIFIKHNDQYYDKEWYEKLQLFIYKTLKPIVPNDKEREQYVTSDNMKIWAQAFTHPSYDPQNNYEEYEMLGDKLMSAQFVEYLLRIEPNIKKDRMTDAVTTYMAKIQQGEMAVNHGMVAMLRKYVSDNYGSGHIKSDVIESFYGALFFVSNNIFPGLGYIRTSNFMEYLFKNKTIEQDIDPAPTFIQQTFSRLGWGEPIKEVKETFNSRYVITLFLTNRAYDYLQQNGIIFDSHVLARETGNTEKATEMAMYRRAFSLLREKGVTKEWVDNHKEMLDFEMIPASVVTQLKAILKDKMGYRLLKMNTLRSADTVTIQLIGINKHKEKVLLDTMSNIPYNETKINQDKISLIKSYLEKMKH